MYNKKLGMIYTILVRFCLFLIWERTQIRPRKIPDFRYEEIERIICRLYIGLVVKKNDFVQCKQKCAGQAAALVCSLISAFLLAFLKVYFPNLLHAKFQCSSQSR